MTTKTTRIGPKMSEVLSILARGPATRIDVARDVGPHGSLRYGYATIGRCLRAGLVRLTAPLPGRKGMTLELVAARARGEVAS